MAMTLRDEIWVWLPRDREGALAAAAGELLYEASSLARRCAVPLIALGDRPLSTEEQQLLGRWGVGRTMALDAALAPHPIIAAGRSPLQALLAEGSPRALLLAADAAGRVLAPLMAAEAGAALVTGVSSLTADATHWTAARPAVGDQYEALVRTPLLQPIVVTLQPGAVGEVMPPATAQDLAAPAVIASAAGGGRDAPRLLPPHADDVDIAEAERIVAFGRGAFNEPAIALVLRLAKALGAAVAGTRPAADEGWLPFERQVGLTGQIVRPRLYVAIGISGAPYHMVGIKDAETFIAINADPEAPIFGAAHLGLVGDLHALLPALLQRLEPAGAAPLEPESVQAALRALGARGS